MTTPDSVSKIARQLRQHLETESAFGVDALGRAHLAPHSPINNPQSPVTSNQSPSDKQSALDALAAELGDCKRCPLGNTRTKLVFGEGNPSARIMFIGEAPGRDEDQQGRPFVGRAGQLLDRIIAAMGLKRSDVYIANVLKCRPPDNRVPLPDEVVHCLPYLERQIAIIQPEIIICLGATSAQHLLGPGESISRIRGRFFQYRGTTVMATYHPAYLLRNPAAKADVWADIQKAMTRLRIPIPKP